MDNIDGPKAKIFKPKASLSAHLIFWLIAIFGFCADLLTKNAVFEWFVKNDIRELVVIKGFFYLVTAYNPGAAFGIASGQRALLITTSAIALILVVGYFLFGKIKQKLVYISLGLLTAGICGNLYDRLFNGGEVRDFIDVIYWPGRHWPAFNIADSMLCVAVGLLIIANFFDGKKRT